MVAAEKQRHRLARSVSPTGMQPFLDPGPDRHRLAVTGGGSVAAWQAVTPCTCPPLGARAAYLACNNMMLVKSSATISSRSLRHGQASTQG